MLPLVLGCAQQHNEWREKMNYERRTRKRCVCRLTYERRMRRKGVGGGGAKPVTNGRREHDYLAIFFMANVHLCRQTHEDTKKRYVVAAR